MRTSSESNRTASPNSMPSWRGRLGRAQTRTFRSAQREAERWKLAVPGDRCRGHRRAGRQWGLVGGEVKSPSIETMKGSLTLLQSILQAGGFLPSANKQQILVLRQARDGKFRAFQHDISKVLQNQEGEIYLRRRDIVYVPKSQIA